MLLRGRPLGSLIIASALSLVSCDSSGPTGPASPVMPSPGPSGQTSRGSIAFVSDRDGTEQIYLANDDGSAVTRLTAGSQPAWSRDGQRLAFYNAREIYVINVDGSGIRRVARGWDPAWSPDGRMLVFRGESFTIDVVDVDGANRRSLHDSEYGSFGPAWSPDGGRIGFSVGTFVDVGLGLWVMNADGSEPRHIGPNDGWAPAWSPDGSQIAYASNSGIGVVNADGAGRRTRVAGEVREVDWTPDGRLIFTRSQSSNWPSPGRRIFISDGGGERQLIPEASPPAPAGYSDSQAAWRR